MSMSPDTWQAVAIASEIGKRPRRILLAGVPVVLFRSGEAIAALHDRCPHRHVELSKGKVKTARSNAPITDGGSMMPGPVPSFRSDGHSAWLSRATIGDIREGGRGVRGKRRAQGRALSALCRGAEDHRQACEQQHAFDAGRCRENILDATHTHFTHKGLLRGLSSERQRVRVDVTGGPAGSRRVIPAKNGKTV